MHSRVQEPDGDGAEVISDPFADEPRSLPVSPRTRRVLMLAGVAVGAVAAAGWLLLSTPDPGTTSPPPAPEPSQSAPAVITDSEAIVILQFGRLTAVDLDGNTLRPDQLLLPHGSVESIELLGPRLQWSADGQRLVYVTPTGIRELDEADGSDRLLLPCSACEIALSPDGRRLALRSDRLEVVDLETGTRVTIPHGSGRFLSGPSWSPDGTRLAVVTATNSRKLGLAVVAADGRSQPIDLRAPTQRTWSIAPAWSPDGTSVAFLEIPHPGVERRPIRVMTVSPSGGRPTQLFRAGTCTCWRFWPGLTWSPDGTMLAVVDEQGLQVAEAAVGATLHTVTSPATGSPAWRPSPP